MFNSGLVRRNGFNSQLDTISERLRQASDARAQEAAGAKCYSGDANLTDERIINYLLPYIDGVTSTAGKPMPPNSTFKYTTSSLLDLMSFDVTDHINLINKPLLMIAGSKSGYALYD